MFTCIVARSDGSTALRTSKFSMVDLAGMLVVGGVYMGGGKQLDMI